MNYVVIVLNLLMHVNESLCFHRFHMLIILSSNNQAAWRHQRVQTGKLLKSYLRSYQLCCLQQLNDSIFYEQQLSRACGSYTSVIIQTTYKKAKLQINRQLPTKTSYVRFHTEILDALKCQALKSLHIAIIYDNSASV